ncbi:MucBP domain-containing protein, partial [Paenibacillus dendrobii]|uniref:MucBP domain-containing protein n=1 Tax=Paenibacillus dendrobii TaxID=2691084 RepID=UPI001370F42D
MKRGLKLVVSWLFILTVFTGFIPGNLFVSSASAASNELIWPNPGAVNLTKTADPAGTGQWKVTLTVEGKNIKTTSDVVLVIDRSGSMDNYSRMTNAKEAANKFVDNLLFKDSTTRVAVVTFDESSSEVSSFKSASEKEALKSAIKKITVSSNGTNIQAGLNKARTMLGESKAQNKVIVLLSDGEPTYSYKAKNASASEWPENKYNFALSDFNYSTILGSGGDYSLKYKGIFGITKDETYTVKGYKVPDNGIGTLSEAKFAKDSGIGIYSIGLEVGNNNNATYVLNTVQNKGYYTSSSADLSKVFSELSGQISYAAQNAIVTDPMGDMFNKVSEPAVSQGTITWDSKSETFTWNVGSIMEGSPATLTYTVTMDQTKSPDPNKLYPTNGTTTLKYDDINGKRTSKDFEVPKVSFGKGSITVKGYLVNDAGQPINADGVVVDKPELAQQLYNQPFKQGDKDSLDINKTYSVEAPLVDGYQLGAGKNPTDVTLTMNKPTQTVWFGFAVAVEQQVNVKYLEKGTNKVLAEPTVAKGLKGKQVDLTAKAVPGYTAEKANDKYTFTADKDQNYTFYYTANKQTVTINYVDQDTDQPIQAPSTKDGVTDQEITLTPPVIAGYTAVETDGKYTFTAKADQQYTFYYKANEQTVTVKYLEKGSERELSEPTTQKGVAGKTVNVAILPVAGYTAVNANESYTFTNKEGQEHIVYYTANKQTVTINYVDQDTDQPIQAPSTKDGVTDQEITLTPPVLAGYTAVETDGKYTFTAKADQQYTFYYKANEQTVTVKYLEKGSERELSEPTTQKGVAGKTVNVAIPSIAGYTAVNANESYTFTNKEGQEHIVYYTANKQKVTINYVDQDTNQPIQAPTTKDGVTDQEITLTPPVIADYTAVETDGKYTFTAKADQQYTFYY